MNSQILYIANFLVSPKLKLFSLKHFHFMLSSHVSASKMSHENSLGELDLEIYDE